MKEECERCHKDVDRIIEIKGNPFLYNKRICKNCLEDKDIVRV